MEEPPRYEANIASSPTDSLHLEDAVISHDDYHDQRKASQNVSSFFRSVEEGNLQLLNILLRKGTIDINAYNDQGMTALHFSVYKFESRRKLDVIECLLDQGGADPCFKAALMPSQGTSTKLSIVRRYDAKSYSDAASPSLETKKISLDQKTPLLLALELKSVLYLRGWEYRHWDAVLKLLAGATLKKMSKNGVHENFPDTRSFVTKGWSNVFESGNHSTINVTAEGKEINALRVLLSGASKKLKLNLDSLAIHNSNVLELKDVSFSITKAMIKFIYTGSLDPEFFGYRGIDLLLAAHKYGIDILKNLCEIQIQPTQENWIKLLTAAGEVDSGLLVLKCAKSIEDVMVRRQEGTHILKKSFSESGRDGPNQLFHDPRFL